MSARATRSLIQSHHRLHKSLSKAEQEGDEHSAEALRVQIAQQGGLPRYQEASLQGQAIDRGGDTSKLLLKWMQEVSAEKPQGLRLLEVGALSTNNACSTSSLFEVTRIDLHSQTSGIKQEDFMERPLPVSEDEKFQVISLSLVLNYVADAKGRGDMLQRTRQFLSTPAVSDGAVPSFQPLIFLVLPAPCISNSRYLDEARLEQIMHCLGYTLKRRKITAKLAYYLWACDHRPIEKGQTFSKKEVNPGRKRNNFCIVLET